MWHNPLSTKAEHAEFGIEYKYIPEITILSCNLSYLGHTCKFAAGYYFQAKYLQFLFQGGTDHILIDF
jgi:hypothetical protein